MTDYLLPDDSEDDANDFDMLLRISAGILYRSADPINFLNWIADHGASLAPGLAKQIDPEAGPVDLFFRALGVQIYNHTPTPDHDFAVHPLPKPERNQPCPCGSEKKYKHCCNQLEMHQSPLADFNMLYYTLECAPKNMLATLPSSKVNSEALADVAEQWREEGKMDRVLGLLEPWFKPSVTLNKRHRWLFDILMDVYQELDKPLKRKRLLQCACEAEDKQLRADAWQRKATIEIDAGDISSAWKSFFVAQKLDPNAPSLALLELTLLVAEGNVDQAKARATFSLARFKRSGDVSPGFLDLLTQCTQDPVAAIKAVYSTNQTQPPALLELNRLLSSAPTIAAHYQLDIHDGEAMLQPEKALATMERQWAAKAQSNKPELTTLSNDDFDFWNRAEDWLPLLQSKPLLWNSFDVLDDLAMGADTILNAGGQQDHWFDFFCALLDRAADLLDAQLAAHPSTTRLPWLFLENRPALRLLAHKITLLEFTEGLNQNFIQHAERLIRLNPNDNHGFRDQLTTAYIANNQLEQAILLASHYEDDGMCAVPLNHVLALYLNNQHAEALARLKTIASRFDVAIKMLLAKSPKQPPADKYGIKIGGKPEAWFYRDDTLELWQQQGALEWLKKSFKKV